MDIKPAFGYVAGVVAISTLVHHGYMAFKVTAARKKYGIKYPHLYADASNCPNEEFRHRFNCVQRGHQNCIENEAPFLALLIAAGLKHPITASVAGLTYVAGKILYMQGYATGNPDKRMNGGISYLGLFTLLGITFKMAFAAATSQ